MAQKYQYEISATIGRLATGSRRTAVAVGRCGGGGGVVVVVRIEIEISLVVPTVAEDELREFGHHRPLRAEHALQRGRRTAAAGVLLLIVRGRRDGGHGAQQQLEDPVCRPVDGIEMFQTGGHHLRRDRSQYVIITRAYKNLLNTSICFFYILYNL